ncbi:UDPglucose 6-dehydrogenase [Balneicella halophila]|uniref:UDP-glucose 6-dehydrogenase n=1 Tax=Balneicella halophila TaxID=1537566 RepID=A0A7L4UQ95_BALHA|nr:UDP-glucose/GDP-mannose dehydrogenase family protein [Balneicella halophila]PVX50762.1 UDPglucose 6-dehydrogenase [Balneicella halophila]
MRIAVVGTGYVGLVTGTCLANVGVTVTCVDIDKEKIQKLNEGIIPIYEPGLEELVRKNTSQNRLSFTTSLKDSLKGADAVFIAVGTPPNEDGSADLQYVLAVAEEIGKSINDYIVIVTKSTVPIGTSKKVSEVVQKSLNSRDVKVDFDVASNPEFLREGNAVQDFLQPERVIVGTDSERAKKVLKRLYRPFIESNHPVLFMDIFSAEMTKYAANAMLATRISFMNEIANLCEEVGANVDNVRKGIGSDSRIGSKFLFPGAGYGGSCFPKDVKALVRTADEFGISLEVLKAVEDVNYKQKQVLFYKIKEHFNGNLEGIKIALWGLAFKANTDDMREASSLVLIDLLTKAGAEVVVYDPVAMDECRKRIGNKVDYAKGQYEALEGADALVVITEWDEFRVPKFTYIEKRLKNKLIFDGRNLYEPAIMNEFGYTYYSIGRKEVKA